MNRPDLVISVRHLTKQFGHEFAVDGASFQVPRGAIFGFIGPSGSGKTTLVRMLTGVLDPSSGEATVMGQRPMRFSLRAREQIGYMPQHFVLYPDLSVWENLSFAASIYGMGFPRAKRLDEVLRFVELYDHRHKLARSISGGMQRRLSLAATLVHDPELLFLDEPTAGIDPVLRSKLWDHFKSLQQMGRTLFVTTQYVGEAAYCDYVGVMVEGRVPVVETPEGLRHRAFGGDVIHLRTVQPFDQAVWMAMHDLPFVRGVVERSGPNEARLIVEDASTAMPQLLEWAKQRSLEVESAEEYMPPYDDVFVEIVKGVSDDGKQEEQMVGPEGDIQVTGETEVRHDDPAA